MKPIAIWALALFIACPLASVAQEQSVIRLAEVDGRTWLITPEGRPFFAHGITHVTNRSLRADYNAVSKACKDLGFNAYGYGCPIELKSDMPYLEGRNYVPISTYLGGSFRFIDIFDPRQQQKLTEQVKQRCLENRDNPNLIGYCWTDLGAWPLKNSVGKNWVDFIRDLPADAPGHKAYAEFTKTWRGDDAKPRDLGFLRLIAREYFRVMGEANRKHDPNHLIFGDRFGFNTIVPEVLDEMLPWVDAIAIQPHFHPGFPKAKYEEIHKLTGKPILICDFAIRFKDGDKSIRGWMLQENAQVAGVHYAKYIRAALETPYIIGAFWCNPIDSKPAYNKTGIKQGLFGEGLKPRPGLGETVAELNQHIAQVTPGGRAAGLSGSKRSTAAAADSSDGDTPGSYDAASGTRMSPLLKALNLTDEQKPKFLAIQKAMTTKWAELQKMPPQERKGDQEAFFKARHEEIAKLLTPPQLKTYREFQQARKKRAQQQKPTQQTSTSEWPSRGTPSRPFALGDYSGNDITGIETILEESRQGDSPWRQQAEQRIDQLRKANLEIRVVDAAGNPLSGVPVHVGQRRHAFRFGGVVNGPLMHGETSGHGSGYKEIFLGLGFNSAGFANYLKYRNRPRSWPHLPALFAWFQEHDIPVRGHCLMWPGGTWGNFLTDELGDLVYVPDPELEKLIRQGKKSILSAREPHASLTAKDARLVRGICERMTDEASRQWPVFEWDVINETRDNHIIQDLVGKDAMVDWFKIARENTKARNALLYLNENKVISDPASGDVTENMKRFENEVQYLLENGAPLSALGFQSRFAKQISPETLFKRLEYFEKFNLPIAATEFEIKNTLGSEQAKAVMTERAMTVLFSHKLVNGIYAWTIRAGGRNGDRAIVNTDGTLNLRGKVWMHLMKNRWWTDESLTTNANGTVKLRGFKGDYIVSVGDKGSAGSMELRLDEDRKAEITVRSMSPLTGSGHRAKDPNIIGRKGFVHVERIDGVWFMVDADGERFVPTGMNHVGPMSRFAPYNRDFWLKQFGSEVFSAPRQINWQGPGVKRWMERIAKDHKDYGFNTLAFHHPHPMPTEYCSELELYYFGKMRMSHVHGRRARTMSRDKKFPDVFDPAWVTRLDAFVKEFTSRHKDSEYLLGYSYDDLPAYTIHNLDRRVAGFEHHPWILDIISKPGLTKGKSVWIDILKQQYPSAAAAGDMYGLNVADWSDFGEVNEWGLPQDSKQGLADQEMMNAKIVEAYLKAHHDAIRRHDPNHLILGDKIQNARLQPDWVWEIVKNYVDVIVIQDYDFFTPGHERKLRHVYSLTGKPIINGDHSYGVLRPNMSSVKGVRVESAVAKGQEYATYLRGIMNLPFMLGWQTCGYLETWEGTADATGKQQTGYFDPFGEPIKEALLHVKAANEQAVQWHERAGTLGDVYSNRKRQR